MFILLLLCPPLADGSTDCYRFYYENPFFIYSNFTLSNNKRKTLQKNPFFNVTKNLLGTYKATFYVFLG